VQIGFNSFFAEMLLPALGGAASPANLVAAQLVFRAILPQTAADGCGGLLTVGVPVHMCVYTSICVCAHMYMYMYIHVYSNYTCICVIYVYTYTYNGKIWA